VIISDYGFEIMNDEEIFEVVTSQGEEVEEEEDDKEEQEVCPVTNSEDECLTWLQHQPEADHYNTSTLQSLRALAAQKRTLKQLSLKKTLFFLKKTIANLFLLLKFNHVL